MRRIKRFCKNALILSGTTLLMRVVSVAFGAFVAGKIGAEGMGLFSLISGVYLFAVTLATSGIQLAVTMLVSEALGKNDECAALHAVRTCIKAALFFGCAAAFLLFFGADFISVSVLGDRRTYLSLRAFSVALPFIALAGVFSGYFSAVRRVSKNALSAMLEQAVKIAITTALLLTVAPRGIEYACLSLVIGTAASEALSFLYLFILYRLDKKRHLDGKKGEKPAHMTQKLLHISLPIALSSYLRSGLVTVEHILIPIGLQKFGADYASALASYGVIHGMAFPLILFPSALCATFAGLIVPELSELSARSRTVRGNGYIGYIVRRALVLALFFGVGVAGILFCFAKPISALVYDEPDVARYVAVFAPLIPIMYLDTAVDGMLKGLGEQLASMIINIIDAAASVLLVWLLLPKMGIAGYVLCVFLTETLNMLLSLQRLLSVTGARVPLLRTALGAAFCIAGATSLSLLLLRLMPALSENSVLFAALGLFLSVALYGLLLRSTQSLSRDDSAWLLGILGRE